MFAVPVRTCTLHDIVRGFPANKINKDARTRRKQRLRSINYAYRQSARRNVYSDQPMMDYAYLHTRFLHRLCHCDKISVDSRCLLVWSRCMIPTISFSIADFHPLVYITRHTFLHWPAFNFPANHANKVRTTFVRRNKALLLDEKIPSAS